MHPRKCGCIIVENTKKLEAYMTNVDAVKALKDIKTYAQAHSLDALDYAIKVLEKLEKDGVKNPLENSAKEGK